MIGKKFLKLQVLKMQLWLNIHQLKKKIQNLAWKMFGIHQLGM